MNEENQSLEGVDLFVEEEEQQPTVDAKPVFAAPFGYTFGNSSVDLDLKKNHDQMRTEYDQWWNSPRGEEKDKLYEDFNQKYFGMSTQEFRDAKAEGYLKSHGPVSRLNTTLKGLSSYGLGAADFGLDAISTIIPALKGVDDRWDEATMLDNPTHRAIRRISSIVIPSIMGGNMIQGQLNARMAGGALFSKPWFQKLLATGASHGLYDMGVMMLSDIGEEPTMTDDLSKMFPKTFGPGGSLPLSEFFRTNTSTSPKMRKLLNALEGAPFAVLGSVIGAFTDIKRGYKTMDWFEPLDKAAANYKRAAIEVGSDNDKLVRITEIDELLALGDANLSREVQDMLINEKLALEDSLGQINSIDDAVRRDDAYKAIETEAAIDNKLNNFEQLELDLNKNNLDPDLNADLLSDAEKAKQSVPPGNVAQNMADTTAIRNGDDFSTGDPAPIITDSMVRKGLIVGPTSRGAVMGVAEEARDIGRFTGVIDNIRFSAKEMNAAAWGMFNDIIDPMKDVKDIQELFFTNKDVKSLIGGALKVEYISEDAARASAFAIKFLFDRFLGRPIAESSARVMDTLGREIDTLAGVIDEMAPFADSDRAMDLIISKLQYLITEYGINKYISGWSLRNKNWFDETPPATIQDAIEQLQTEFTSAENVLHEKAKAFTKEIKKLQKEKPEALKPLIDTFSLTNGDVDSLAKLYKWAEAQITPFGLLKSPDPKNMNLFAKGVWGVRYNNMLSGLAAFNAGLGNSVQLVMKPLNGLLGHGIVAAATGNLEGAKRLIYYNSSIFETNRRALTDAFRMMKKAHQDPQAMMNSFRKDYVFKTDKAWNIMEDMVKLYEKEGKWGEAFQYKIASTLKQLAGAKWLRYGMTGMVFPDVFVNTHMATYLSRANAYADVIYDQGFPNLDMLKQAEVENYAKYFDKDGLVKNDVIRALAGEMQLNLDDGLSKYLQEATTAFPVLKEVMAFPRTASNYMKAGLSYTPISLIPNMNKYAKTMYATTQEDMVEALALHGIDYAKTPNAQTVFEDLKAEYIGRQAFANLLTFSLYQYAVAGNIRGNGHYNASRRNKERDQGYEPKTIKIGNTWYSYKGWIGIEHVLAPLADLAYYMGDMDEHVIESWQSKIAWTVGATFLNDSPLFGLEKVFDMLNGNERAVSQFFGNMLSNTFILNKGGIGVIANMIHQSQKDIEGDIGEFVKNGLPGFKGTLANKINPYNGQEVKDVQNPVLAAINAISPVKFSDPEEPWELFLRDIAYTGHHMLRKDSSGSYEWKPEDREIIYKYLGEQRLDKQIERIMKGKQYQGIIKSIKNLRRGYKPGPDGLKLKARFSPVHREIDAMLNEAMKIAEQRYLKDKPLIQQAIYNAQLAKNKMQEGDVEGAEALSKKDAEIKQLIQHGNN
tara:strand:- start:108 stop:4277 length:4170 start_codon:yes stop_codon:yes gene_type:complete